jgi:hypothetical protein
MDKKTKQDMLDTLDEQLLSAMIKMMDSEEYDSLPQLATISNYLAKNNKVQEKERSSVDDEIKKRLEEAKKRREGK